MAKGEKDGWRGEEQKESQKDKRAEELVGVIQKIAINKELLREFLIDLLSPAEYRELGVRWQIVQQLNRGVSQRDVSENLRVGIATVTRGSRELANPKGGFRRVLKILEKK
ncbi:MAG: hypothetical protein HY482_01330 [Candidatus Wildermuthbacteria bacterium]|nr:hypothetical protein [Candidatus Wildermuthbacteria bacterium]